MTISPGPLEDIRDFSMVLGGPLYQLMRRSRLAGEAFDLLARRVIVITTVAWLPLLLIVAVGPVGGGVVAFLRDVEVHVRFLVALPVLIVAELLVHLRMRPVVRRFIERNIVRAPDRPRFHRAVDAAVRLRDSIPAEVGLLIAVYVLGLTFWNNRAAIEAPTWFARPGGRWHLTAAGYWYVFVSIPIAQFILLRWYFRFVLWYRFLWQVSRIELNLMPTHPDRAAGLGFVGKSVYAFGPILFAQGSMLAGLVASRIFFRGDSLLSFKVQIGSFVAFFVFVILGPLLMFTPQMARAKRRGLAEYGQLAQQYVEGFERKWVRRDPEHGDELLGAADIQSLADLGNSYGLVRDMRAVPFGLDDITRLAVATAAPFTPLLLTIISFEELVLRIVGVVF